MSATPLVTVIIPTYNSSKTLRLALQTVQRQTLEDFEVCIVGDGCTDDSEAVVASLRDSRFHWSNLPQRVGIQSGPNNEGIRRARGRYIAYLGHDDLWFPWHLSDLVALIERRQSDLVFSLCARVSPEGMTLLLRFCEGDKLMRRNAPPSAWLHRRDLIDACGPWNCRPETLLYPVDLELWRRVCLAHKQIDCHPQLSVLKFPSVCWRPYAPDTRDFPQDSFLSQMLQDARTLQLRVLTDLSLYASEKEAPRKPLLWRWMMWVIRLYGIDRAPFLQLRRWRFQKDRRRRLKIRGL